MHAYRVFTCYQCRLGATESESVKAFTLHVNSAVSLILHHLPASSKYYAEYQTTMHAQTLLNK